MKKLICNQNELKVFDLDTKLLANLEMLDVYSNNFTSFRDFRGLMNLKKLHCYNNHIVSFEGIECLYNLEVLYCYNNDIKGTLVPLKRLINLKDIDCCNNNISGSFLPLKKLKQLKELTCNSNEIVSENFDGLQNLTNLTNLECSGNRISGSFVGIMNLSELYDIHCYDVEINSFKGLPIRLRWVLNDNIPNGYTNTFIHTKKEDMHEFSGTSKFLILTKLTEDSFFSWTSRDKNNINKLYDYFYYVEHQKTIRVD